MKPDVQPVTCDVTEAAWRAFQAMPQEQRARFVAGMIAAVVKRVPQ